MLNLTPAHQNCDASVNKSACVDPPPHVHETWSCSIQGGRHGTSTSKWGHAPHPPPPKNNEPRDPGFVGSGAKFCFSRGKFSSWSPNNQPSRKSAEIHNLGAIVVKITIVHIITITVFRIHPNHRKIPHSSSCPQVRTIRTANAAFCLLDNDMFAPEIWNRNPCLHMRVPHEFASSAVISLALCYMRRNREIPGFCCASFWDQQWTEIWCCEWWILMPHINVRAHTQTHTQRTHARTHMHTHTHKGEGRPTYTLCWGHTDTRTDTHTHTHTHAHTHVSFTLPSAPFLSHTHTTHTHTHAHTHTLVIKARSSLSQVKPSSFQHSRGPSSNQTKHHANVDHQAQSTKFLSWGRSLPPPAKKTTPGSTTTPLLPETCTAQESKESVAPHNEIIQQTLKILSAITPQRDSFLLAKIPKILTAKFEPIRFHFVAPVKPKTHVTSFQSTQNTCCHEPCEKSTNFTQKSTPFKTGVKHRGHKRSAFSQLFFLALATGSFRAMLTGSNWTALQWCKISGFKVFFATGADFLLKAPHHRRGAQLRR